MRKNAMKKNAQKREQPGYRKDAPEKRLPWACRARKRARGKKIVALNFNGKVPIVLAWSRAQIERTHVTRRKRRKETRRKKATADRD